MAKRQGDTLSRTNLMKNLAVRELMDMLVKSSKGQPLYDALEEASSTGGLDPYCYEELNGQQKIRLLNLRSAGASSVEVECELFERDLESCPEYEALSWSWGGESWDRSIRISKDSMPYRFDVPSTLIAALRSLRHTMRNRVLWVDAICINQGSPDEKNNQVPMMADIYGRAKSVCVWIGPENEHSKIALDFIKEEVLKLQEFDELCENEDVSYKWRAMLDVMKSSWFSRRWVIQEIALAKNATIHCGSQTIPWKDFCDAVQLFVEVETATHRLSDVMKKDPQFFHVPGWFEYVSRLGASLLVDATGNLFRRPKGVGPTSSKTKQLNGSVTPGLTEPKTADLNHTKASEPERLLSLEYLVSSMTVFQATIPHDTIYALLAIARDTAPSPRIRGGPTKVPLPGQAQLERFGARFGKRKPYTVDYQQPLVDVCQGFIGFCIRQSDPTRALDIICRPWAPTLESVINRERKKQKGHKDPPHIKVNEEFDSMPTWIPTLSGAAHAMFAHASGELRMGRQNADTLVGLPGYTQRNYSAAGTRKVDELALRFKKYGKDHYSMFVSGFICDEIDVVCERSQSGNIPDEWIEEGRWGDTTEDPPEELWRTLVADRGKSGRNPPTYYARACKESINKGLASGSLNTQELIEHGRCSVVAEFFRRVQSVIWNRSLMRTQNDTLGIVNKNVSQGDLVCVLYGCTVPVVLRRHKKTQAQIDEDEIEYARDRLEAVIRLQRIYRERRAWRRDLEAKKLNRKQSELERQTTQESKLSKAEVPQGTPRTVNSGVLDDPSLIGTPPAGTSRAQSLGILAEHPASSYTDAEILHAVDGRPSTAPSIGGPPLTPETHSPRPSLPPKPSTLFNNLRPSSSSKRSHPNQNDANSQIHTIPHDTASSENEASTQGEIHASNVEIVDEKQGAREDSPEKNKKKIRKAEQRRFWYEFIGECYVYGMMDGEAIAYQNANQIPAQTFEIW